MTRSLAVDENNDIYVGSDGSLAVASAREAVLHCCAQAAKTQLGEMIYAVDFGLPNFGAVWNGAPNVGLFEAYLRRNLQTVQDVISVDSVTIQATGGALVYSATIKTIYGPGAINGSV